MECTECNCHEVEGSDEDMFCVCCCCCCTGECQLGDLVDEED